MSNNSRNVTYYGGLVGLGGALGLLASLLADSFMPAALGLVVAGPSMAAFGWANHNRTKITRARWGQARDDNIYRDDAEEDLYNSSGILRSFAGLAILASVIFSASFIAPEMLNPDLLGGWIPALMTVSLIGNAGLGIWNARNAHTYSDEMSREPS